MLAAGFSGGSLVKNMPAMQEKISGRRAGQSSPVLLPGETHTQRSLAGYSPQGSKESDTTETTEHAR